MVTRGVTLAACALALAAFGWNLDAAARAGWPRRAVAIATACAAASLALHLVAFY